MTHPARLLRLSRMPVAVLVVSLAVASTAAAAAPVLGQPDAPPGAARPSVALPGPATPVPPASVPPVPDPPPATAASSAPTPSARPPAPAAPSVAGSGAEDAAAQAQTRRRAQAVAARRAAIAHEGTRTSAAVTRIGRGIDGRLAVASTALSRWASASSRLAGQAGGVRGGGRATPSVLIALVLLFVSGLTAGVALLPRRPGGAAAAGGPAHPAALSFVERHRLPLAGVATSCLLVALLVVAGL